MKNLKLYLVPLAILLFIFSVVFIRLINKPQNTLENLKSIESKKTITQTINYGDAKPNETLELDLEENETVLSLIKKTKKVKLKEYSFGVLVESIDDVVNGENNKSWIFYVNSKESQIGAGEYKLKPGDVVEWKYKTYEE